MAPDFFRRLFHALSVSALFVVGVPEVCAQSERTFASVARLEQLLEQKQYVAFRIFVRKNFARIKDADEWLAFRDVILRGVDRTGYDLLYSVDRRPVAGLVSGSMNLNEARNNADTLLVNGRFEEAFAIFQTIAEELKRVQSSKESPQVKRAAKFLSFYIFHAMGRALYGARRFDEAYQVYRWIPQSYSKIREIQFEKMWAAFRGGRVDHALGAVASQNSGFFGRFVSPEAYLVQTYLYKKLCREADYQEVFAGMKAFQSALKTGAFKLEDFARGDAETLVLWQLITNKNEESVEAKAEKSRIKVVLQKAYERERMRLRDDLEKALAYVRLAVRSGVSAALKPIEKLPDRQAFFKIGLEIWPADSLEEWADEIGSHRFIGDTECKSGS